MSASEFAKYLVEKPVNMIKNPKAYRSVNWRAKLALQVNFALNDDECLYQNDELCVKNDEICVKKDEYRAAARVQEQGGGEINCLSKMMNFMLRMMNLVFK